MRHFIRIGIQVKNGWWFAMHHKGEIIIENNALFNMITTVYVQSANHKYQGGGLLNLKLCASLRLHPKTNTATAENELHV